MGGGCFTHSATPSGHRTFQDLNNMDYDEQARFDLKYQKMTEKLNPSDCAPLTETLTDLWV